MNNFFLFPDKDLTFLASNLLFLDNDFQFLRPQFCYFTDKDIWKLLGAWLSVGFG